MRKARLVARIGFVLAVVVFSAWIVSAWSELTRRDELLGRAVAAREDLDAIEDDLRRALAFPPERATAAIGRARGRLGQARLSRQERERLKAAIDVFAARPASAAAREALLDELWLVERRVTTGVSAADRHLHQSVARLHRLVLGTLALAAGFLLLGLRTSRVRERLEQVERTAHRDTLTRGLNRRAILAYLSGECSRGARYRHPVTALVVDLDHFKAVNDTHGHAAGDRVIATAALRMRGRLRPYDAVGRIGGDEFLVVLPDCDAARAEEIARRLCDVMREPMELGIARHEQTVSIGGAVLAAGVGTPKALLEAADAALYSVKRAGRDGFAVRVLEAEEAAEQPAS